ncbi:Signal transduction histidine kinase [Levilactobacillus senmaizukei DSM 21775 = NBRC 103853]|uniref:histidine kinase n=2 Tax=Levilactobacillus senmaizukei TaxID=431273 RepID=A0A0R2DEJ9_9LACO|nr:HAMP domain-containing sensor histidine kinase [Levilactobacillus senmaizukei]KRN02448.1 Signal transduction histidine kinase [Levilactobacillus senmaizukei DSM 21775 = NBRC 103853]
MMKRLAGAWVIIGLVNSLLVWLVQAAQEPWALVVAWSLALLETVGLGTVWHWAENRIHILTKKVEGIRHEETPAHVLLSPHDPFQELALQINYLQTHQRKVQRQMAGQNQEFATLLDYLPIGVMVIDRYRKVELANPAMEQFLQHQISPRRHPFTQDISQFELASLINSALSEKRTQQRTLKLAGVTRDLTVDARAIYTATSQDYFQVLVLLYDVTEVYAVEQMQMDFVSNASHELKTPVTAISGFAKTLLAGAKDDPEKSIEFLKIIDQQSERLVELINDVLTISHIESGNQVEAAATPVGQQVASQVTLLSPLAAVNQVTLINQVDPDIVEVTDPHKFDQILKNVLGNAIKYNRPQGTVTLSSKVTTVSWTLTIADTGIGIAPQDQLRVFERFYRAELSHSNQLISGSGLGLAIVRELVESLNGKINLESTLDVGTTVTLTFPIVPMP